jgi:hypothetical protein
MRSREKQQDAQKGHPARPEGAKPPERTPVREEAERPRTPLVAFFSILLRRLALRDLHHRGCESSPVRAIECQTVSG